MPGTFSSPPRVSKPDMHHGTCVTHVPWCMSGSLTIGFFWSLCWGKRCRQSRCMRTPQFYVSGKRPMGPRKLPLWSLDCSSTGERVPWHPTVKIECSPVHTILFIAPFTAWRTWYLIHWRLNKMAETLLTFSNELFWKEMFLFWLKFHCSLLLMVQLRVRHHFCSGIGLAPAGAMSLSEPVVSLFIDAYMHHFDLMRASAIQVLFRIRLQRITPGLLSKVHVKIHVSKQGFSSMASDWLAAVLCAN